MTEEYDYKDEKFAVSKPDDCEMKVSKDGCIATITALESGEFKVDVDDGSPWQCVQSPGYALEIACVRILKKLRDSTKQEKARSQLNDLYERIRNGQA